jgi:hypothetical protein
LIHILSFSKSNEPVEKPRFREKRWRFCRKLGTFLSQKRLFLQAQHGASVPRGTLDTNRCISRYAKREVNPIPAIGHLPGRFMDGFAVATLQTMLHDNGKRVAPRQGLRSVVPRQGLRSVVR